MEEQRGETHHEWLEAKNSYDILDNEFEQLHPRIEQHEEDIREIEPKLKPIDSRKEFKGLRGIIDKIVGFIKKDKTNYASLIKEKEEYEKKLESARKELKEKHEKKSIIWKEKVWPLKEKEKELTSELKELHEELRVLMRSTWPLIVDIENDMSEEKKSYFLSGLEIEKEKMEKNISDTENKEPILAGKDLEELKNLTNTLTEQLEKIKGILTPEQLEKYNEISKYKMIFQESDKEDVFKGDIDEAVTEFFNEVEPQIDDDYNKSVKNSGNER